ncbi:MAG: hypothetical protein P1V97_20195 [Planctomycetota bacterium]|nr:hypothetical protein [Planctomycetota bacterium]
MGRKKKNKNQAKQANKSAKQKPGLHKKPPASAFDALDQELAEAAEEPKRPNIDDLAGEDLNKDKVMGFIDDVLELAEEIAEQSNHEKTPVGDGASDSDAIPKSPEPTSLGLIIIGAIALIAGIGTCTASFEFGASIWNDYERHKNLVMAFFILSSIGLIAGLFGILMIFETAKWTAFSMGWRLGVVLACVIGLSIASSDYHKGWEHGRVPLSAFIIVTIYLTRRIRELKLAKSAIEGG